MSTLLTYKGQWDPVTNSPSLADGVGTAGDTYLIYHTPPYFKGYFIQDRDLGSGVTSWPALEYITYDGSTWVLLGGTGGGGGGAPSGPAGGDLGSNYPNPSVQGLKSKVLPALSTGLLKYNGSAWVFDSSAYITLGALSEASPITYNSTTGVIGIQVANTSQGGYLSNTDWNTFNAKQAALSGTGIVKSSGGTISYISGTSSQFLKADGSLDTNVYVPEGRTLTINGTSYDLSTNRSWTISTAPSGTAGGDLGGTYPNPSVEQIKGKAIATLATGLLKYNGTSWVFDGSSYIVLSSLSGTTPISYDTTTGAISIQVANTSQSGYLSSTDWNTFSGKQAALSGTGIVKSTAGTISYISSTSANFIKGDGSLDSTVYTPVTRTLTINGTAFDLSANRAWTVTAAPSGAAGGDLTGTYPNPTIGTNKVTYDKLDVEGELAIVAALRFISGN